MTDSEIVEILATKGMKYRHSDLVCQWLDQNGDDILDWNPLTDLNAVYQVEERLTVEERREYAQRLERYVVPHCSSFHSDHWFALRHAEARTCATALAKVLGGLP